MNSKYLIGIVIVVVVIGGAYFLMNKNNSQQGSLYQTQTNPTNQSPLMAKNAVTIQNMAFSPTSLTVKVGDQVMWTNQDSISHSATADDNSFDTGVLANGQSGSITFSKAGTYTYHCKIHPATMKGTIIVQ